MALPSPYSASQMIAASLDHIDQGVAVFDRDGNLVVCNEGFRRLLDLPDHLLRPGTSFAVMLRYNAERGEYGSPCDVEAEVTWRFERMRTSPSLDFERTLPNGTVLKTSQRRLPDGGHIRTYADITREIAKERELREKTDLLTRLLDFSPSIIAIRDVEGRYQLVNAAYETVFNTTNAALKGKTANAIMPDHFVEDLAGYDRTVIASGMPMIHEHAAATPAEDGRLLSVRFPITDEAGNVVAVGSIATDVTDMRRTERALIEAKESAEKASRTKSEFLAHMSHELRTPLNSIIGFSDAMLYEVLGPMPDVYREYASLIRDSGRHLLDIISKVLDLSKIEMGGLKLLEAVVDTGEVVDEVVAMLSVQQASLPHPVAVTHEDGKAPRVMCDRLRLKQILVNLLANAFKYADGGQVTILSRHVDGCPELEVRDTGPGIDPQDIPRVLEPFNQLRTSHMLRAEGTGLGLSLSKRLIEEHGGELEIKSAADKGTSVTIRFPRDRAQA